MSSTPKPRPDDTEVDAAIADAETLSEALFWIADKYGADVTNNYPGWKDGRYLRHVGDFTAEVQAQIARFQPPANSADSHAGDIESERWESAYWHLAAIEKSRFWTYKASSWRGWCQFGSDEYGRRTLVVGAPFLGALVVALFKCRCHDCKVEATALREVVESDPLDD